MNRKGQLGIIVFIFTLLLFLIIWASWLGGYINTQAQLWITNGELTGFNAFLVANLNLWIFLILLLVVAWGMYGVSQ